MGEFVQFKKALQDHFNTMVKDVDYLFEVGVDKDEMWNLYLDSYPNGTNEIFRERREYDCSCCRQFIKNIGNVVAIKDGNVVTIWDFNINHDTFNPVRSAMNEFIKSKCITNVYKSNTKKVGTDKNYENTDDLGILTWEHFCLELPNKFVMNDKKSYNEYIGSTRDVRNVFKRSLDEITKESVEILLELIAQNSLYKGEEWKGVLSEFLKHKKTYEVLSSKEKELYTWQQSLKVGAVIGKIRNHSIGTLLVNISEGVELDTAVQKYEKIVAPSNYKRPKAIFTQKMLDDAKKTIEELGYLDSLNRRYATLDDITVNNILFTNKDSAKRISGIDIFDEMSKSISLDVKKFNKIEEIPISTFINDVLPNVNEIEVLLENKHSSNMVSLITSVNKNSDTMFKWNNNFSWSYSGNITDSDIKDKVKSAGGNVDGILRFSIQWNDEEYNGNDLDAHCVEPSGNRIYFSSKRNYQTTGALDIDIIHPSKGEPAVENITWTDRDKMLEGKYIFQVHNFTHRGGRDGFKAEIEFDGEIYSFNYNRNIRNDEYVEVAEVYFDKNKGFRLEEKIPSSMSGKEIWNIQTNQFVPVSTVMYSPNYWDNQNGIGNRHYFFMLKDCINPETPNGFYNEFLKEDLMKHKRVFEALGSKMKVQDTKDQLSGLGFSSTKRSEVVVKAKGATERMLKIKI